MHFLHVGIFLVLAFIQPSQQWFYMHGDMPDCVPQKTPLHGQKWCNFTRKSSELGAVCHFKCNEGYYLQGTSINTCRSYHSNRMAKFDQSGGKCMPRPPAFISTISGPFKFSPRTNSTIYLSAGENSRLVATSTPINHGQYFEIFRGGMINRVGAVSFLSRRFSGRYVVVQGTRLLVVSHSNINRALGSFHNVSSFYARQDKFIAGFTAFESVMEPGKFITISGDSVRMLTPTTHEQKMSASFTWTR
ncbi:uncharacterized protein LOC100182165 isoform X1 [Ciona intestinalis]